MKQIIKNQRRTLHLQKFLTREDADRLIYHLARINFQGEGEIFLQINSSGGDFFGALKLYENIILSPNPVTGVVIGDCFSAANLVLQACQKRQASEFSRLLVHHVKNSVSFTLSHDDTFSSLQERVIKEIETTKNSDQLLIDILKRKFKIKEEEIVELMDKEIVISSNKALEIGMIDQIM